MRKKFVQEYEDRVQKPSDEVHPPRGLSMERADQRRVLMTAAMPIQAELDEKIRQLQEEMSLLQSTRDRLKNGMEKANTPVGVQKLHILVTGMKNLGSDV